MVEKRTSRPPKGLRQTHHSSCRKFQECRQGILEQSSPLKLTSPLSSAQAAVHLIASPFKALSLHCSCRLHIVKSLSWHRLPANSPSSHSKHMYPPSTRLIFFLSCLLSLTEELSDAMALQMSLVDPVLIGKDSIVLLMSLIQSEVVEGSEKAGPVMEEKEGVEERSWEAERSVMQLSGY